MGGNTLYQETIRPQDESFLRKITGINREWTLKTSINKKKDGKRFIQATWRSDRAAEDLLQTAEEILMPDSELDDRDLTSFERIGPGQSVMANLGEDENLVYTESTGHATYTGPESSTENLKDLISETHLYEDSDVEHGLDRLDEIAKEYLR